MNRTLELEAATENIRRSLQSESLNDLVGADLAAKRAIAWAILALVQKVDQSLPSPKKPNQT